MTDHSVERFDLIIIGSGSGNAIPDEFADQRIAIVERGTFGGTCLNVGCIPSKMFVLPADVAHGARHAGRLGLDIDVRGADWDAIRDRVFGRIDPIAAGGREYRATGSANITLIEGTARFVADKVLDVDGRPIAADTILVATGSRPTLPEIDGLDEAGYHTSDSIMRLERFPARLGIIGGGYIAVEMGHVFSGLGADVSLFNRSGVLLRAHDAEIAERFTEVFSKRVHVHLDDLPSRIERRDDAIAIYHRGADGETFTIVDELLVATGRRPNSDLLDVDAAGLELRADGTLAVDRHMRTNVDGVWAIGDIANEFQLKHVANHEAEVAFWNIAHPDALREVNHHAVPAAVFSNPQVAAVGLTEAAARDAGLDIVVGRRDFGGTAYGWALADETSFAKVLVDRGSGQIVGAHIIGPQAATLIQPLIQAMQFRQAAADVAREPYWIHPALTEVVENALLDAVSQI